MNRHCAICNDILFPQSKIATTSCGHTAHEKCLSTCQKNSKTCPTCRQRTTAKTVSRIYLNWSIREKERQDRALLKWKLINAESQLKAKEQLLRNNAKKCTQYKEEIKALRERARDLVIKSAILNSTRQISESRPRECWNEKRKKPRLSRLIGMSWF